MTEYRAQRKGLHMPIIGHATWPRGRITPEGLKNYGLIEQMPNTSTVLCELHLGNMERTLLALSWPTFVRIPLGATGKLQAELSFPKSYGLTSHW